MKILLNILAVSLLSVAAMSQADEQKLQAENSEKSEFTRKLQQYFPKIKPDSVRPSPVNGLYEVIIGPRVYYLSQDARYLVSANIIDLQAGINLTKPRMQMARLDALERIGEDNMVTFSPAKPEYIVTAFTDIDCVYCRKMHSQIKDYNKLGIAIRYLFYPRAGMGSKSYKTAMSVWCNKERKKAFTDAKAGKEITFQACDNPISAHMKLCNRWN